MAFFRTAKNEKKMCGNFTVANLRIEKQDATDEEAKKYIFLDID